MWTPKRISIYFLSLLGFLALFGVAAYFGSGVDGLPLLPPHYEPSDHVIEPPTPSLFVDEREFKIRQAFGNDCDELKRESKIYLPSKGAVLAFDDYEIMGDGRVMLRPFSIALFPKTKDTSRFPEINTVQCEFAYLALDRPITSPAELGRCKVVGVELGGRKGVKITNNRKSQEKSDDLELYVTERHLFYEDARNLIWSNGYIKLLDTQSQPLPTQITAVGLEVQLSKDVGPNRDKKIVAAPAAAAKKADAISGVEKIALLANVDMYLYIDARSGFMAGPEELANKQPAKANPQDKSRIHIKTNGKFVYDLAKESARFDAPEQPGLARDRVIVTRHQNAKLPKTGVITDLLDCDRLDLQFRKKASDSPGSSDKEIESAIATAKADALVELHLEGEEMHAFGVEMHYFAPLPKTGPRTIIKGRPMHAMRQGHQIQCEELHLKGADKQGNGQESFAKGPGKMDLFDKQNGRSSTHITFKNSFTSAKDKDGDRVYELMTLKGDAAFIDDDHKQELHAAQFLHIWLEEVKATPANLANPKKDQPVSSSPRHRLHKIEAFDKVQVRSPEMNIRDANHLTVLFREQLLAIGEKGFDGVPALPVALPKNANDIGPSAILLPPSQKSPAKAETDKMKKPLELTAGEITAYVATVGNKKELLEFVADGNVHVTQEADSPKDKGLDIVGNILKLLRKPGGDILHVFGEPRKLAQLQFNEMLLFGPEVTIDQVDNVATVVGTGAMNMPSNTTLDGKKKDGHITIHWNKSMWFNGRSADFDGGVEAFQDNGKIRCQQMQVTLDKPVHFKQTKGSQTAKIDKILCNGKDDQQVFILEEERDKNNKIVMFRRLMLAVVEVDNKEQRMVGSGPGVLDYIGHGSPNDPVAKDGQKIDEKRKEDAISKWTRVRFNGTMVSYPTAAGTGRQTTFLDQVRVFHQPGEDPNVRDPMAIAKDGLFLTCQKLIVIQRKVGNKNSQEMLADGMTGLVNFQTHQFHGSSKSVKYDESQDLIIFEGNVTIYELAKVQGAAPKVFRGNRILYNRKTGEFNGEFRVISSWLTLPEPRVLAMATDDEMTSPLSKGSLDRATGGLSASDPRATAQVGSHWRTSRPWHDSFFTQQRIVHFA